MTIWWDNTDTAKPWQYDVQFSNQNIQGSCASLADCWREIDTRVLSFTASCVQDNNPVYVH